MFVSLEIRCRVPVLVLCAGCARGGDMVPGAGRWCCELAVHVVEARR